MIKFGLLSLGDHVRDPHTGRYNQTEAERHRFIVELCVLAEKLGFHGAWLGEHHFSEYALAAPQMLLAAVAERTSALRLSTAVTLLGTQDPVRVAEDFATLDILSNGRAELCVGRGIIPDSYAHFGLDIKRGMSILDEKIGLLLRLWREDKVDWSGDFRSPLKGISLRPRPLQKPHPPLWYGGGSSEQSLALAVKHGLPLVLPGIFNPPEFFVPMARRYRQLCEERGLSASACKIAIGAHLMIRDTTAEAEKFWQPYYQGYINWSTNLILGRPRPELAKYGPRGPMIYGDAERVAERILEFHTLLGLDSILCKFDGGGLPKEAVLESVRRFGEEVMPRVEKALGGPSQSPSAEALRGDKAQA